ncbi:MAG: hypothetical protein JXK93_05820 [Sphaerochaetaceae bacterium]|nr:hypothetical protein [Sphaerochaetaceae bacterium]
MKRICIVLSILIALSGTLLFAAGETEQTTGSSVIIRVADNMPGLITPGQWNGQAFSLNSSVYDYPVVLDPDTGELKGEVLSSWESEDGLRWILTIRQDIVFHDGSTLDADDLIFTLERTQDSTVSHVKQKDFEIIESVNKIDAYTVEVVLKEVRPGFIYQLSDYNMAVLSRDYDYSALGETSPMGSGPFTVQELVNKEYAHLVAFDEYWEKGFPLSDEVHIYFVSDRDTALSMLINGQVDIVPFITPIMKQRVDSHEDIYVTVPYTEQRFLSMRVDAPPFNDNTVRLALKHSLSPTLLARGLNLELGSQFYYSEGPVMETQSQFVQTGPRKRDPQKARDLLKQAGYPEGLTVTLTYAGDHAFNQAIAQSIQEQAKEGGFTILLKGYPRDIYFSQYWMQVPLSITTWGGRVDPAVLLSLAFDSRGVWNESHVKDPVLDEIISSILTEVEAGKLDMLYRELQEYFYDVGPLINIQVPYLVALTSSISGYTQPLTMLPVYKYIEKLN